MSEIKVQPEILSSLRSRADYLSLQNPEQTADDIYQIMLLKILEKAEQNLTFLDQKPAYIITYAVWQAKNQAKHDRIYVNFIEDQPEKAYQEEDDNDFNDEPFCLLDDNPSPEETVIGMKL